VAMMIQGLYKAEELKRHIETLGNQTKKFERSAQDMVKAFDKFAQAFNKPAK
jgi:hypothetical protein